MDDQVRKDASLTRNPESRDTTGNRSGTQAIQRATRILKEIGAAGTRGLRVVDLCERLPIERPTLHRMLTCLADEKMIARDERSKRYFLGDSIYKLGLAAAGRFNLRDICETPLTRISNATGDTVFLATLGDNDGIVLDKRDGPNPIRTMPLEIGMRRPLGVGSTGLAMLSALPDVEIDRIIKENSRRLREHNVRPDKLPSLIARSRKNGYAFSRGYGPPRICGVALPLQNGSDRCIGAISVTALSHRMTSEHRQDVLAILRKELAPVTQKLRNLRD